MRDIVKGDEELDRRLKALASGKAERKILGQWALLGVKFAKDKVPRKTGNLGRTIRVGRIDVRAQRTSIHAGGRREVGYAAHVEFGTRGGQIIVPKRGRVLAWGGARRLSGTLRSGAKATNFATRVRRGATPAQPYLLPGAKQALREVPLAQNVIETWNRAA